MVCLTGECFSTRSRYNYDSKTRFQLGLESESGGACSSTRASSNFRERQRAESLSTFDWVEFRCDLKQSLPIPTIAAAGFVQVDVNLHFRIDLRTVAKTPSCEGLETNRASEKTLRSNNPGISEVFRDDITVGDKRQDVVRMALFKSVWLQFFFASA